MLIAGGLLVVAAGAGLAWRVHTRGPSRPSVSQAIDRYRSSSTVPARRGALEPPPGVYVYTGSGSETLTFMNTHQGQGPTEPATVTTLGNGCWSFELDYNTFHSQKWVRCDVGGKLVERGGTANQKFDFIAFTQSEQGKTTCDPPITEIDPHAEPGTQWPVQCRVHSRTTNTNSTQTGTFTYVGPDTVEVGGVAVPTWHGRQDVTLRGGQTGTVHIDIWFAASNGLPVHEQHAIRAVSSAPAPINHVTYNELGEWTLTSLTPRR
jgi:hypothetical protein